MNQPTALAPVTELFLRYVGVDSASNAESTEFPTSPGQLEVMHLLKDGLLELGTADGQFVDLPEGELIVRFPATKGLEDKPYLCLSAHVDTYPGVSGAVTPIIHPPYRGGSIVLPKGDVVIPAEDLTGLEGKTIITGSGDSLLGADDKGGLAVIVDAVGNMLLKQLSHGPLDLWICTDEEIGRIKGKNIPPEIAGAWDVLLTVDGGPVGEIDLGCFACRMVKMEFYGADAHPGVYPHKLHRAHYAAMAFAMQMEQLFLNPYAGIADRRAPFFYIVDAKMDAGKASLLIVPRSFDEKETDVMMRRAVQVAQQCARAEGCTFKIVSDETVCINNRSINEANRDLLQPIYAAHAIHGVTTSDHNVRGGTDGAGFNMIYPTCATPNIGYGSRNLHGKEEFLVVDELECTALILKHIIALYTEYQAV
ncbi:MAG: M20/M25/M40 family metallo-hydrolase [Patescibacteria group bacterium]